MQPVKWCRTTTPPIRMCLLKNIPFADTSLCSMMLRLLILQSWGRFDCCIQRDSYQETGTAVSFVMNKYTFGRWLDSSVISPKHDPCECSCCDGYVHFSPALLPTPVSWSTWGEQSIRTLADGVCFRDAFHEETTLFDMHRSSWWFKWLTSNSALCLSPGFEPLVVRTFDFISKNINQKGFNC